MSSFSHEEGQSWVQFSQLVLAVALSAAIGVERQLRQKSAGLRTNTLVGLGSALFVLVSQYGFMEVVSPYRVVVDPSRIAAQIVSGIGFIGGGIIFKQQSDVRGLTTAAAVWLTAAIGAACAAGLPILASIATALYFVTVAFFPFAWTSLAKLRSRHKLVENSLKIRYRSLGNGLEPVIDEILKTDAMEVSVKRLEEVVLSTFHSPVTTTERQPAHQQTPAWSPLPPPMMSQGYQRIFDVEIFISAHQSLNELACSLSRLDSVISVSIDNDSANEI